MISLAILMQDIMKESSSSITCSLLSSDGYYDGPYAPNATCRTFLIDSTHSLYQALIPSGLSSVLYQSQCL